MLVPKHNVATNSLLKGLAVHFTFSKHTHTHTEWVLQPHPCVTQTKRLIKQKSNREREKGGGRELSQV